MYSKVEVLLINGNNVLKHNTLNSKGTLENLIKVLNVCEKQRIKPIVIVSARTRYAIDDPTGYDDLVKKGIIYETLAGSDPDLYILETAQKLNVKILSNDLFRQYKKHYPKAFHRRVGFMIVHDEVIIPSLINYANWLKSV